MISIIFECIKRSLGNERAIGFALALYLKDQDGSRPTLRHTFFGRSEELAWLILSTTRSGGYINIISVLGATWTISSPPEEDGWAELVAKGFDQPRHFAAFVHTLRWNDVTATDPNVFQRTTVLSW
jgi:hypothetical protein